MKNVLKKVIIVYGIILGISFVASIIFIVISVTINSKKKISLGITSRHV